MKFLFDENLSHTLVEILAREFPDCTHIRHIGLRGAEDGQIWDHARAQHFMIVSKDLVIGLHEPFCPETRDQWGRRE